jgi:hypothetical protein
MALNNQSKMLALTLSLVFGALAAVVSAFAEILLALPLPVWFYGLSGLLVILPVVIRPSHLSAFVAVALIGFLIAFHLVPWTSRKPFLHQLNKVRPGMTEAEVRVIMTGYKEGTGWPAAPWQPPGFKGTLEAPGSSNTFRTVTDTNSRIALIDSLVFRHSDDGRFNSDWGVVEFKDGRVIRVQFMPD